MHSDNRDLDSSTFLVSRLDLSPEEHLTQNSAYSGPSPCFFGGRKPASLASEAAYAAIVAVASASSLLPTHALL